ncbi:MAG TPA: alpha/beta hydrolase [Phenylobacterium sp.]|jgi:hypothetical protein|nr:alpha/beta hydrolase [Phenylobacterium sp.]
MEYLTIQTGGGPISLLGRILTDQPRPSLVAVRGSFPPREQMLDLQTYFHGANVLFVTWPGMAGSFWAENPNVEGLTRGVEQAVEMLLPDAPIVAFGASTGNLVSLGLKLPNICRRVAVEPFFQTRDLWPFIANSRERMKLNPGHELMARFFWEVFGIAEDRLENRDYGRLLDGVSVPTDVVVGQAPLLPVRDVESWPSFTSAEDRARLAANPLVTLHEGPPGTGHTHGLVGQSYGQTKRLIHAALLDATRRLG